MGHSGGITSLSSKGNGFNFLSNAKDQVGTYMGPMPMHPLPVDIDIEAAYANHELVG